MAILSRAERIKSSLIGFFSSVIPFSFLQRRLPRKFVVYGHLVSDRKSAISKYYRYPSLREFDRFIGQMKRLGYVFVGLEEYMTKDDRRKILLTFDDGFREIYDELHPYMKQNQIPYVLFILTDPFYNPDFFIKTIKPDIQGDQPMFLSAGEIMDLKGQGVHIGFHTRSHYRIEGSENLNSSAFRSQVAIPREWRHLFSDPLCFAYPYAAPVEYEAFDQYMKEEHNYDFFFDTKGFSSERGDHFFRVSIDVEPQVTGERWIEFVLKRQLLLFIWSKLKKV